MLWHLIPKCLRYNYKVACTQNCALPAAWWQCCLSLPSAHQLFYPFANLAGKGAQGKQQNGPKQVHFPAQDGNMDLLPRVALVGRPNVGKSALFNRLVRKRTALVYNTPLSHVTRDWQEQTGQLGDLTFRVMDTSGMEPSMQRDSIQGRAASITASALSKAHLALMVVDARDGIITQDEDLAVWLRKAMPHSDQVLLVANKAEGAKAQQNIEQTIADCWRLGFGEPVALSASSGEGMADLYNLLQPHIDSWRQRIIADALLHTPASEVKEGPAEASSSSSSSDAFMPKQLQGRRRWEDEGIAGLSQGYDRLQDQRAEGLQGYGGLEGEAHHSEIDKELQAGLQALPEVGVHEHEGGGGKVVQLQEDAVAARDQAIRLAIVGLPNVGKSTLLNTLLGEERVLTGPEPGLTRDVVRATLDHQGTKIDLLDTAGYVGATKVSSYDDIGGEVADLAREAALSAMASAHVVLLVVDVASALKSQKVLSSRELTLVSRYVLHNGKALVIAANKMDALPGQEEQKLYLGTLRSCLEERLLDAGIPPVVPLVARSGKNVSQLLDAVLKAHQDWDRRVSTGRLNRFLAKLGARMSGGGVDRDVARLKYLTQVKTCPPTFVAFVSGSQAVDATFPQFLSSQLREALGLGGTPLRFWFRYKDARTQQVLEGTLHKCQPANRGSHTRGGSQAASSRSRTFRRSLAQRLLKPRLYMAERGRVAAAETEGLKPSSSPSTRDPAGDLRAPATMSWQAGDEHYFGRGGLSSGGSNVIGSRSNQTIQAGNSGRSSGRRRRRAAQSGSVTNSSRKNRELDSYMQHSLRSPAARCTR